MILGYGQTNICLVYHIITPIIRSAFYMHILFIIITKFLKNFSGGQ